jgi:cysteine desulfurase family protein (TIGR01976 family)
VTSEAFPIDRLRREFPALERAGDFVFFDNAAGAQVPKRVLDAVNDHLIARNVQRGGVYRYSREVDAMIARARASVAVFVNASSADEIAFGLNATSFIRAISLGVGQTLGERDEIIVTDLDHEANIATWLALERAGARIVWWRVRADHRLHVDDLRQLVSDRTRLVACTLASNAIGARVDVRAAAEVARHGGAELFVDAVHYGPHGLIDVQAYGCDYLVCSGYKIFAPHMGFVWCRREAIDRLPTFREHFIPDTMPDKLEAGTYVYENVAGMDAAVGYIEDLGRSLADDSREISRRDAIEQAMHAIATYERGLSVALVDAILAANGTRLMGFAGQREVEIRVPTVSFTVDDVDPNLIVDELSARGIGARSGHMYSPRLMHRLGVMPAGVVRISLVHYNTAAEIARFREALAEAIEEVRSSQRVR